MEVQEVAVKNEAIKKFSRDDMGKFYRDLIMYWEPSSEVWPFKHGDDLVTGAGSLTSIYITSIFRRHVKIRQYSRLTCYTPVVGLSAIGCYLMQAFVMNKDLMEGTICPVCTTLKASTFQLFFGLAYPLIMAPIITFYVSDRLLTYPIPSLQRAPREVFNLWLKIVSKNPRPLIFAALMQSFVSCFVTERKMSFFHRNF